MLFDTPFGERHFFYTDYTASGRGLRFIEEKILNIQKSYANTHTEDDYSGRYLTRLLHKAESRIKELVNAGPSGKIITAGSGSTGALQKLQEIIGVYIPPVTKERIYNTCQDLKGPEIPVQEFIEKNKPVVFIGPYEHHTNELMWRESFADVEVVGLDPYGQIDLEDLKNRLADFRNDNRPRFASFSAGSNITGIRSRVYEIARICHSFDTHIFFDFAAVAPYVPIDMNRDKDSYFDAIFFSPHKFLGGPGSTGVLIINEKLYRTDLPPTTAGGGTVVYVGFEQHEFSKDIETREKAGTPPIIQTIRAALAMDLKEKIGTKTIEDVEREHFQHFTDRLHRIKNVQTIGRYDMDNQTPIVSFNIKHKDRILHPKFVTKLLNDLFGIQSRAGCSCAGPYGHILLGIDTDKSNKFRKLVLDGYEGFKPGWIRINIHFTLSHEDVDFLCQAIEFIAQNGFRFLEKYTFDRFTGEWNHIDFVETEILFSIEHDFETKKIEKTAVKDLRDMYLHEAESKAREFSLSKEPLYKMDPAEIESLKYFYYIHSK